MTSIRRSAISDLSGALPCRSLFFAGMQDETCGSLPGQLEARSAFLLPAGFLAAGFLAALFPAFPRRRLAAFLAATGAALLPALVGLVDCRPGAFLGLFLRNAPLLVPFFDVLSFPLLLRCVTRFVSPCHA